MTPHPSRPRRIEDEAALWASRLHGGGMTDRDRVLLNTWLDRNPANRTVLARYRELCGQLDRNLADELTPVNTLVWQRWGWQIGFTMIGVAAVLLYLIAYRF